MEFTCMLYIKCKGSIVNRATVLDIESNSALWSCFSKDTNYYMDCTNYNSFNQPLCQAFHTSVPNGILPSQSITQSTINLTPHDNSDNSDKKMQNNTVCLLILYCTMLYNYGIIWGTEYGKGSSVCLWLYSTVQYMTVPTASNSVFQYNFVSASKLTAYWTGKICTFIKANWMHESCAA